MKRTLVATLAFGLFAGIGLIGCDTGEEAKVEQTTTAETPGGTTEVTKETKVETEGENPPIDIKTDAEPEATP